MRNEGNLLFDADKPILAGAGGGRVENTGTFQERIVFTVPWIEVPFLNQGVLGPTSLRFASLENSGLLILGGGPRVEGDFVQHDTGTLRAVSIYDGTYYPLRVGGQALLAGGLEVDYIPMSPPNPGVTFTVLEFASRVGDFATFTDFDPGDGIGYSRAFTGTSLTITTHAGEPLRAAGGPLAPADRLPREPLHVEQVLAVVEAALARWSGAGISAADLAHLRGITWRVGNLSGDLLGLAAGNTITLDDDAAGHRWFIDPTPRQDDEFSATDQVFAALGDSPASGRMDLLTVLLHELGHELGLEDLDPAGHGDELMAALLAPGTRRLPEVFASRKARAR